MMILVAILVIALVVAVICALLLKADVEAARQDALALAKCEQNAIAKLREAVAEIEGCRAEIVLLSKDIDNHRKASAANLKEIENWSNECARLKNLNYEFEEYNKQLSHDNTALRALAPPKSQTKRKKKRTCRNLE